MFIIILTSTYIPTCWPSRRKKAKECLFSSWWLCVAQDRALQAFQLPLGNLPPLTFVGSSRIYKLCCVLSNHPLIRLPRKELQKYLSHFWALRDNWQKGLRLATTNYYDLILLSYLRAGNLLARLSARVGRHCCSAAFCSSRTPAIRSWVIMIRILCQVTRTR